MRSAKENAKKEPKGKLQPQPQAPKAGKECAGTEKKAACKVRLAEASPENSPPCTRSQKERFAKRQMQEELGSTKKTRIPSDSDGSVLKSMGNLTVSEKKPTTSKKVPVAAKEASTKPPIADTPTVIQGQGETEAKAAKPLAARGKSSRRKNNP